MFGCVINTPETVGVVINAMSASLGSSSKALTMSRSSDAAEREMAVAHLKQYQTNWGFIEAPDADTLAAQTPKAFPYPRDGGYDLVVLPELLPNGTRSIRLFLAETHQEVGSSILSLLTSDNGQRASFVTVKRPFRTLDTDANLLVSGSDNCYRHVTDTDLPWGEDVVLNLDGENAELALREFLQEQAWRT